MSGAALDGFDRANASIQAAYPEAVGSGQTVLPCDAGKVCVRIVVKDERFALMQGLAYRLELGGEFTQGSIPSDGIIQMTTRAGAEGSLEVTFGPDDRHRWPLKVADIDPLSLETGAEVGLSNLALLPEQELSEEEALARGLVVLVEAFSHEAGTGFDDKNKALLERVYSARDTAVEDAGGWTASSALAEEQAALRDVLDKPFLPPLKFGID
ncbi:hypothetical protein HUW63_02825 [Myxococcus sp. AM001]|nr:hypothetical protein [Myxococcus sp. AM001]